MAYTFPMLNLLGKSENVRTDEESYDRKQQDMMGKYIVEVMAMWNMDVQIVNIKQTPLSIFFDIMPESGSSIKSVSSMKTDLEVRLGREIEITNSENAIRIVVLYKKRPLIGLRYAIESVEFQKAASPLNFAAGIDYCGRLILPDIEQLPHMLVAGTTGSGKTIFLDDIILSILYKATPDEVKLILIDPKEVDFKLYNGIPHLLAPVVYEERKIFSMLDWTETEMMRRYEKFARFNVKNVNDYNFENGMDNLPQIVVIIDEYSELMEDFRNELEGVIERVGRLGRAAGIHLIIATQRPTTDIITGSIKLNLPGRASFTVVDSRESTAIINKGGAQKLCGSGDMLFSMSSLDGVKHLQAPYVSEKEIKDVVKYVVNNNN